MVERCLIGMARGQVLSRNAGNFCWISYAIDMALAFEPMLSL